MAAFSRAVLILILSSLLAPALSVRAQDPPDAEDPKLEFFSGNIVELSDAEIIVGRSLVGKAIEKRTFQIKPETKVEGKLKVRARVTVGFAKTDGNDVAMQIIVRPDGHKR